MPLLGADRDATVSTGCLAGVREQVEQYLFQLALSACDRWEIIGDVDGQMNAAPIDAAFENRQRCFDCCTHVPGPRPSRGTARKREHAAEDPPAPLERPLELSQVFQPDCQVG